MKHKKGQAVLEWCIFGAISLFVSILFLRTAIVVYDQKIAHSYSIFAARQALSKSPTPNISNLNIKSFSTQTSGHSIVKKSSLDQKIYQYQKSVNLPNSEKKKMVSPAFKLF